MLKSDTNKLTVKVGLSMWSVTFTSFEGADRTRDLHKAVTVKDPNGKTLFTKTTPFTEYLTLIGWHAVTVENPSGGFDHWEGPNNWTSNDTTFGLNPSEDNTFRVIFKAGETSKAAQPGLRFPMKVGVSVFGYPSYFSIQESLSEFQSFVQANSRLDLQIVLNQFPPLAPDEYHPIPERPGCKFVDPWYVHPETLAKLPLGVAVQIVIYDIQNTDPGYGGRAYQPSAQTRNLPFIAIAFGESIRWWPIEANWKSRTGTALVHEFYHSLTQLLQAKGLSLPDADKANAYGYTTENDPGWVRFDKFLYGQITDQMYAALTK